MGGWVGPYDRPLGNNDLIQPINLTFHLIPTNKYLVCIGYIPLDELVHVMVRFCSSIFPRTYKGRRARALHRYLRDIHHLYVHTLYSSYMNYCTVPIIVCVYTS